MQYCNNCGKEIPINANVCSYCGTYFDPNTNAGSSSASNFNNKNKGYSINADQQIKKRPLGITVISILFFIGGIMSLIGILSGIQGIVSFAFGIVYIIVGWGLWKGKRWAWLAFIILTILGVVMSIVSISFIYMSPDTIQILQQQQQQQLPNNVQYSLTLGFAIIISIEVGISLLLIYYFYKPHVKEYFGKS